MASDEHPPEDAQPETGGVNAGARGTDDDHPGTRGESEQAGNDSVDDTLPRMLAAISEQVGEIRDQLERLLNVQFDRLRLRLRTGLFWLLLSLLLGAVCVVATATAVLYVLDGVSGLFTALLGGNVWAGDLAAGGLVLLSILLMVAIFAGRFRKRELGRLKQKYEPGSTKGEAQ